MPGPTACLGVAGTARRGEMVATRSPSVLKRCGGCDRRLDRSEFHRDASRYDGLARRCKRCACAKARQRHAARRPEALARMREYGATSGRLVWSENRRRGRARRRKAEIRLVTEADWRRLVARYRGLCAYCKQRPWTDRDHIIPLSRGGRHSIGNLLPACEFCNTSKHNRLLVEWRAA